MRVGQGGRIFTARKLRTMVADAERDGKSGVDDRRMTRASRALEKFCAACI